MSKFKLTQTAAEVQGILNNSLQKPTGLTKTKLVGVGVNGQENIEIGDNLTLANGKLSSAATGGGGGGSQTHGYSVMVGNFCHYEIYTTEDYDWMTIGESTDFSAIFMEDQYKALRAIGTYPAAGYSSSDDMYISRFYISEGNQYSFKGYSFSMKSYIATELQPLSSVARSVQVTKLF